MKKNFFQNDIEEFLNQVVPSPIEADFLAGFKKKRNQNLL